MPSRNFRKKNPFLYPETNRPFLLDTKEFSFATKIPDGSSTMNKVRNRMDVVLVGPQEPYRQPTVRQPLPYVLGLETAIKANHGKQIARVAMAYSETDEAQEKIIEGRAHFKDLLDIHTRDGFIYSADAAGILNIWPEAIYHWQRTGVVYGDEVAKGVTGDERELFVARSAIERLCEWRLPESRRESGIPGLPYPPEIE
jgi:hypothetical protein